MKASGYIIALAFSVLALIGLWMGGWFTLIFPLMSFVLVPVVELFIDVGDIDNREQNPQHTVFHDLVLLTSCALTWSGWVLLIHQLSQPGLGILNKCGMVVCAGILFGGLGINVAHELGHRREKLYQNIAKAMLFVPLYMHFYIEHNRGHHRRLATPEDPATARKGETVYAFLIRSVVFGWLSAWSIEAHRLRGRGPVAHLRQNQMLHFQLLQLCAVMTVGAVFGPTVAVGWIASAAMGVLLLELVNYVEHYGLVREKLPNGKYERVSPRHSWTADHPISRALLFEVPRHADHHAYSARPYGSLRHFSDAHQLPTGYSGMVLLALVPPLFFRVMDRQLEKEQQRLAV